MKKLLRQFHSSRFFIRLTHWEYWPFHVVYFPVYPVWLWFCIKARSFFFFAAANPSIKNGGFLMESKKEIDKLIPEKYKPLTLFFEAETNLQSVIEQINQHHLHYPLIVKPDTGLQGIGVCKVYSQKDLGGVIATFNINYIIQPFIEYPNEIGLFYVRYPNEKKGFISGIVKKEFLQVTGDGRKTMEELIMQNKRYILQLPVLKKMMGDKLKTILPTNATEILVPFGNHARGSLFTDVTEWKNEKLEKMIDEVCQSINGFYFGRLDIRYNSFEELQDNKNWCIIELNGAGSEPTHIYDPAHSLFFGWKEIIRHWKMLYKVSQQNKAKSHHFLTAKDGLAMFRENKAHRQKLRCIASSVPGIQL